MGTVRQDVRLEAGPRSALLKLATQPRNEPNLSPGWLVKIDRVSGELLGSVEVTGVHGMDVMPNGNLLVGPGPGAASPRWFRLP